MTLYTKGGLTPQTLPASDVDDHGDTWTNLQNNPEGLAACGWTAAPDAPEYDPVASGLSWNGETWIISPKSPEDLSAALEAARASLAESALAYRESRIAGNCETPQGPIAASPDTQRLINGAVTAVLAARAFGQPFPPVSVTMADDSVVLQDGPTLVATGLAIVAYVNACRSACTAILERIQAAQSASDLAAIDITLGYS